MRTNFSLEDISVEKINSDRIGHMIVTALDEYTIAGIRIQFCFFNKPTESMQKKGNWNITLK